uniref:LOB domain-containing protein n=1 Tax=Ananas comosus var. bracteatus TaxID=296719 RepID=A0A6V7QL28_ANACO|nr:unnamed protein product [Ananas comosus var. bracteatus]
MSSSGQEVGGLNKQNTKAETKNGFLSNEEGVHGDGVEVECYGGEGDDVDPPTTAMSNWRCRAAVRCVQVPAAEVRGDCVFAPYFSSEHGAARFVAIHKVFGASNVSKLLLRVPPPDRCEAVVTVAYEAQARLRDPVYGCVSQIFALQQQYISAY